MRFYEALFVRKEVDDVMNAIKKHWPVILHAIALAAIWLGPSVTSYLKGAQGSTQWAGTALVIWAEINRWLQSPKNAA